jgi:putative transposase
VAAFAGDLWYGDVLHGPKLLVNGTWRKGYLVSLMDDASRLVAHSAFALDEGALAIEGVLRDAILKRGLPKRLVVDNGAAYRAQTLQAVCARLGIHLIHCRPYAPEGKGKLERWHRTLRDQFLSEIDFARGVAIEDANARLWAWLEAIYHRQPHGGLEEGISPLARYQRDLPRIRTLGPLAREIEAIFYHRIERLVRRDGTVSYQGRRFEVPYALVGRRVRLVVDPHRGQVMGVEDAEGRSLGAVTPLDRLANRDRPRARALPADADASSAPPSGAGPSLVDLAVERYYAGGSEGL